MVLIQLNNYKKLSIIKVVSVQISKMWFQQDRTCSCMLCDKSSHFFLGKDVPMKKCAF